MIRAQVIVRPRKSIFDPQGDAVCRAIQHLGVANLKQAHVGKCIELELEGADAVLLPGGLSYGDYLRCGAIARFSPIMPAVKTELGSVIILLRYEGPKAGWWSWMCDLPDSKP